MKKHFHLISKPRTMMEVAKLFKISKNEVFKIKKLIKQITKDIK